ncbi:MAG: helix-turn-helix domain-containing protein [Ignavibacteriales bacterium]
MSLAVKLKDLRLRSGLSLQQVADGVGASKAHIWELETGKSSNPSIDLLKKLAELYKVSVASLVGEALEDVPPEIIQMHRDLSQLTDTERALVDDIIQGMKRRKAQEGGGEH